jgi:TetR/AcrR family transcriptional regulator
MSDERGEGGREDRRTAILDAAIAVLEREGAAGFKQTRIAEAAALEQGHLTYYFPKKHDLAIATFEHFSMRSREALRESIAEERVPLSAKRLLALVGALVRDHKRTRVLLSLVLSAGADRALADRAAAFIEMQRATFAQLLGRKAGDLDAEVALAALRGIGLEQMLLGGDDRHVEARIARIAAWLERSERR